LIPSSEIAQYLCSLPLFSGLGKESITMLARSSYFQHADAGQIVFFQSDPSDFVYIVRAGKISLVLSSSDGRAMVINEMHPGDMFGELGIITRRPRSTSAIVHTDSDLLVIPRQAFLRIMDEEPKLARLILEMTANRLQMSSKRESALAFLDAQARLARLLLELEEEEHEKGYITISQEELANRTGLIRQTVAKALGKWRRSGWLITGRGRILILNREALEQLENSLLV
jgi:CRP-like cAMP-binding protein